MNFETNRERLDYIIQQNEQIIKQNDSILSLSATNVSIGVREMQEVDDLVAEVTAVKEVDEAMGIQVDFTNALLDKLGAKIDELLAAPQIDKAKLVEVRNLLQQNNAALAAKKEELKAGTLRNTKFDSSANA